MAEHAYDRGGGDTADNGRLTVELDRFYGEDVVSLELAHGASYASLTAVQARAVAADLNEHADRLERPGSCPACGKEGIVKPDGGRVMHFDPRRERLGFAVIPWCRGSYREGERRG